MPNQKYILTLLLTVSGLSFFSQIVPGYQGKKNIISYQDNISLSFNEPSYLNRTFNDDAYPKTEESVFVPFNNTHSITYERVVKRRMSVGLNYSFAATKTYVSLIGSINDPKTNQPIYYGYHDIKTNVFAHYFTGSLIFYSSKNLAPLGNYFKMTMGYCMIKARLLPDVEFKTAPTNYTTPSDVYTLGFDEGYIGMNKFTMGFTLGSHRIYGGRWVMNRGMTFNILFKGDDPLTHREMFMQVRNRAYSHDLFTFFLGVGYLL